MKKRNMAMLLAFSILGTTLLSGCSQETGQAQAGDEQKQQQEGSTLSFAWWGSEDRQNYTEELLEAYTKEHTDISFTTSPTSWDGYWEKLATQTAGGNCPDIVQMDYAYIVTYAKNNTLADLQKFVDDGTIDVSNVEPSLVESGRIDGILAGIPLSTSMLTYCYNPSVLEEAGLEAPDAAWTWADFSDYMMTIKEKTGKPGLGVNYNDVGVLHYFVRQHGETFFNEDYTGLGYEDDQIMADFIDIHKELTDAGAMITPDEWTQISANPEESRMVPQDEAGFTFGSNTIANMMKSTNDTIQLITPPMAEDGTKALWLKPGMYLSISASASEEVQKKAAEFINWFLNSEEAGAKIGTERGIPAAFNIREALKEGSIGAIDQKEKEMFDYYDLAASVAGDCPPPDASSISEINKIYVDMVNQVMYDRMDSLEAAKSFREQVNKVLAKNP